MTYGDQMSTGCPGCDSLRVSRDRAEAALRETGMALGCAWDNERILERIDEMHTREGELITQVRELKLTAAHRLDEIGRVYAGESPCADCLARFEAKTTPKGTQ